MLVELSSIHRESEEWSNANAYALEALEALGGYADDSLRLELLDTLAQVGFHRGEFEQALPWTVEGIALSRRLGDDRALASLLVSRGWSLHFLADSEAALPLAEESFELYQGMGDARGSGDALILKGGALLSMGRPQEALETCLAALELYENAGYRAPIVVLNLAVSYFFQDRFDESLELANKAREYALVEENDFVYAICVQLIGNIHRKKGEWPQALALLQEAYQSEALQEKPHYVAEVLQNIGDTHIGLGDLQEALSYHQRGLSLFEGSGFKDEIASSLVSIGRIELLRGQPNRALTLLERAMGLAEEIDADERRLEVLEVLAEAFVSLGSLQKAIETLRQHAALEREIYERENTERANELRTRFEVDRREQEIELLQQQKALNELELREQRNQRVALLVGFALVLALVLLLFKARLASVAVRQEREVSAQLRAVDRLKDEFLANTSHELRTPLYGITGIVESLIDGAAGEVPETVKSNLAMVVASGRRLSHLVNDILDFSKLRHKSLELDRRPVELHALVDVVLTLSAGLVGSKDLRLINAVAPDLPAAAADENRLQQILYNLIGNAIKFTEEGRVKVSAAVEGERLVVRVVDTGLGIPEEEQERIFDAFEQADASVEREYGGTGLGLAVTRQLVELHGGTIGVESAPGEGATFFFSLQIAAAAAETGVSPEASEPTAETHPFQSEETSTVEFSIVEPAVTLESNSGGPRVLVVDDEPVNLQVVRNYLAVEDFDLTLASSGEQALRLLEEETFDLVLLDVMMPRISGYEVCRSLREHHSLSDLPVIFLTAKTRGSDVVAGMALGANDYLTKPISKDRLLARVRPHLELLHVHRNLEDLVEEKISQIKVLSGLLPICATCKKIRDDEGYWSQLELFIDRHSEARFSHGICPDCLEQYYEQHPELRRKEPS